MVRKTEQERRAEIIAATIKEVAKAGSLNVTISQIAKSAGMSAGLTFHYFKDKDSLFLAAMRDLLRRHGEDFRKELDETKSPRERFEAIVHASFSSPNFTREAIYAWLIFYTLALSSSDARRLLYVYQRRLHSNLVFEFRSLIGDRAPDVARRIAGLIDGLYLRYALDENVQDGREAVVHILRAFDAECREIQENEDSSAVGVDPSPMDPISKPQE